VEGAAASSGALGEEDMVEENGKRMKSASLYSATRERRQEAMRAWVLSSSTKRIWKWRREASRHSEVWIAHALWNAGRENDEERAETVVERKRKRNAV